MKKARFPLQVPHFVRVALTKRYSPQRLLYGQGLVIFHGYSVRRVLGTQRSGLRRKMGRSENQGPIHLDISGWQAILSIRFFM
jgi:hypothetical protein